jgi:hypothetical protein
MKNILVIVGAMLMLAVIGVGGYVLSREDALLAGESTRLIAALCVPGSACGGRIITQPRPCIGSGLVTAEVLVAGLGAPINYVWGITKYLYGPPKNVGQNFVGKTTRLCHCSTSAFKIDAPCSDVIYGTSSV